MAKIFQIIFTLLAALCIAAAIPVGAYIGWTWCIALLLAGAAFAVAMFLVKGGNPFHKAKANKNPEDGGEEKDG